MLVLLLVGYLGEVLATGTLRASVPVLVPLLLSHLHSQTGEMFHTQRGQCFVRRKSTVSFAQVLFQHMYKAMVLLGIEAATKHNGVPLRGHDAFHPQQTNRGWADVDHHASLPGHHHAVVVRRTCSGASGAVKETGGSGQNDVTGAKAFQRLFQCFFSVVGSSHVVVPFFIGVGHVRRGQDQGVGGHQFGGVLNKRVKQLRQFGGGGGGG